jgi:hypothetical protein
VGGLGPPWVVYSALSIGAIEKLPNGRTVSALAYDVSFLLMRQVICSPLVLFRVIVHAVRAITV